jgi:hypothetical protein
VALILFSIFSSFRTPVMISIIVCLVSIYAKEFFKMKPNDKYQKGLKIAALVTILASLLCTIAMVLIIILVGLVSL